MSPAPPADPVDEPVVVLLDADGATQTDPEPQQPRSRGLLLAGIVGAVVGAAITAAGFMAGVGDPQPIALSYETFPEHVFGLDREDLTSSHGMTAVHEEYVERFAQQLVAHQFVYGGEGAAVYYVGPSGLAELELTIVNAHLPPDLPYYPELPSGAPDPPEAVEVGDVRCTFNVWYSGNQDGEYILRQVPNCVLNDEDRNLSLRMRVAHIGDETPYQAAQFVTELEVIHDSLVG